MVYIIHRPAVEGELLSFPEIKVPYVISELKFDLYISLTLTSLRTRMHISA